MLSNFTGLEVQKKLDGVWVTFTSSTGKSASINVTHFDDHSRITEQAMRDWALDQLKNEETLKNRVEVPPFEIRAGGTAKNPDEGKKTTT